MIASSARYTRAELLELHTQAIRVTVAAAHDWLSDPISPTTQMNYEAARERCAMLAAMCAAAQTIES